MDSTNTAAPHNREEEEESSPDDSNTVVELATLALPSAAAAAGLESGDGTQLVLECRTETVEQLQTNIDSTQISGVVDLERLSELVGASEQEFIAGLHMDAADTYDVDDDASEGDANEETPLLASDLEKQQGENFISSATEQIKLPADPFIESLAEVLPTLDEDTVYDAPTEAAAYATDHEHHFAHDAFLINVPSTTNLQDSHFVLALPEIHVEPSVQTETSELSDTSWHLERAMSILPTSKLPTDIQNVQIQATDDEQHQLRLDVVVERKVPVIGYVILFSGLVALSSVGAALDLQQGGVSSVMKTLWRQTATAIVIIPMVLKSIYWDGMPHVSAADYILFLVSAAAYAYMTLAFVWALEMTTMANAFVLSNMTSLVIIAGRVVLGLPVLLGEGGGAAIGFVGAAICANDKHPSVSQTTEQSATLGNLVAFSASFGMAAYLLVAKRLRPKMDLFVFMFGIMSHASIFHGIFLTISGQKLSFDMDPTHGLFGWFIPRFDRLWLELYLAIVCNCLGMTGYIAVMKYFDPVVPATVMLLEPVVGALLGTLAGTAPLPDLQTWLGDLVVAGGTLLVIQAGAQTKESIDATDALRTRLGTNDSVKPLDSSPMMIHSPRMKRQHHDSHDESSSVKVIWDTKSVS